MRSPAFLSSTLALALGLITIPLACGPKAPPKSPDELATVQGDGGASDAATGGSV